MDALPEVGDENDDFVISDDNIILSEANSCKDEYNNVKFSGYCMSEKECLVRLTYYYQYSNIENVWKTTRNFSICANAQSTEQRVCKSNNNIAYNVKFI